MIYGVGRPRRIPGRSAKESAERFLQVFGPVYGLAPSDLSGIVSEERQSFLPGHREVILTRSVGGRPLFGARLRLHLGPAGEFVAAVGNLHGALRWAGPPSISPDEAVLRAATLLDRIAPPSKKRLASGATADRSRVTEVAYPLGGEARPAFLVAGAVAGNGIDTFDVVIDGVSGEVLEVVARTFHSQGQVYQGSSGQPQSPQPSSTPGVVPPTPDPPAYVPRTTIPFTGWLTGTTLSGNNANVREFQAWTGEPLTGASGNAITAPTGDFSFALNLGTGLDVRNYPQATGTNLFYLLNAARDYFYPLGFDEAHGNFQADNFGLGGLGGDPVLAFTQLGSGTATGQSAYAQDNASMTTPADGSSPIMRMYVWSQSGTPPSRIYSTDSSLDPDVVFHEFAHGVTGRLAPGALPYTAQCGALNEGNSDFFALNIQVPSTAPLDGSYPVGTYSAQSFTAGLRTHPYSTLLAVNPLTYANLGHVTPDGPEVHADGEIWATALWEVRAALVGSLGFATGRTRAAQLVVDALQLLPSTPTFVDFRNAILAADQARYGGADRDLLWGAFAKRGLGALAAGGPSGYSFHVLSDATLPSPAARVRLWESSFYAGEPVRLLVADNNAASSTVTVTTSAGDSETFPLTATGPVFSGSIPSAPGTPIGGDGTLQLLPGDTIAATTTDSDPGGGTPVLTATAIARAPYSISVLPSSLFDAAASPTLLFKGDETSQSLALPFPFPFFGQTRTSVDIAADGLLSFGFPREIRERGLGRVGAPAFIAPFSVDLDCTGSHGVYAYSAADRFTVRWDCVEWSAPLNAVNVAATLFPDGKIRFDYGAGNTLTGLDAYTFLPDAATVGLARGTDKFGEVVPGYDQSTGLGNAASVLIAPPPECTIGGFSISGPSTGGCDGTSRTLDAGAGYAAYAWSQGGVAIPGGSSRTLVVTTGGTYDVVVIDASGCRGTASHPITYTPRPVAPVVTAPVAVLTGSVDGAASVADHPGSTFAWTIANGSITSGQGTSQIVFTAGTEGTPLSLSVVETNPSGCASPAGTATVTVTSVDSDRVFMSGFEPLAQCALATGPTALTCPDLVDDGCWGNLRLRPNTISQAYTKGEGGPDRISVPLNYGHVVYSLANPGAPSYLAVGDIRNPPVGPIAGDGQSFVSAAPGISSDGQRSLITMEITGYGSTIVGKPKPNAFEPAGNTGSVQSKGGLVVQKSGSRYIGYGLAGKFFWAADVTTTPTSYRETPPMPFENQSDGATPGTWAYQGYLAAPSRLQLAEGNGFQYLYWLNGKNVVLADASGPGPSGGVVNGPPSITAAYPTWSIPFSTWSRPSSDLLQGVSVGVDPQSPGGNLFILGAFTSSGVPSFSLLSFDRASGIATLRGTYSPGAPFTVSGGTRPAFAAYNKYSHDVDLFMWARSAGPTPKGPKGILRLYATSARIFGTAIDQTVDLDMNDPATPQMATDMALLRKGSRDVYAYVVDSGGAYAIKMNCVSRQ